MTTKNTGLAVINVHIKAVGGLFYASSPQLPGLHVCGITEDAVIADVPAVVKQLYKLNYGRDVEIVEPAATDFTPSKKKISLAGWANFLAIPHEAGVPA